MIETLYEFIQNIFGTYRPIVTYDTNLEPMDVAIDWGYIAAVVIFCIIVYMVLKCVGGVIRAICSK